MRKTVVLACLLSSLTFLAGLVVGQKAGWDRFSKYEKNGAYSGMDVALLQANLGITRTYIEAAPGVSLPNFYFDKDTRKLIGISIVNAETLKKIQSDDLKKELMDVVGSAFLAVSFTFDQVKSPMDSDFEIEFRSLPRNKSESYYMPL